MTYRMVAVCTGNICRSPMAEYALRQAVRESDLADRVEVISAATTGWEVGNPVDSRAGALLQREGLDASTHQAQAITRDMLAEADLVLALDHDHVGPLQRMMPAEHSDKVHLMRAFDPQAGEDKGIRDPYHGSTDDFELAWEQISAAIPGVLEHVRGELSASE